MKINHIVDEDITRRGFLQGAGAAAVAGAGLGAASDAKADHKQQRELKIVWLVKPPPEEMAKWFGNIGSPATADGATRIYLAQKEFLQWWDTTVSQALDIIVTRLQLENSEGVVEFKVKDNQITDVTLVKQSGDPAWGKRVASYIKSMSTKFQFKSLTETPENAVFRFTTTVNPPPSPIPRHPPNSKPAPIDSSMGESVSQGVAEAARPPVAPDPQNYDSDWDYYNDRDADDMTDSDPADDITDNEPNDWFDESKEKVGNMDADAFDAALSRMKKLAGAGPLRTVYDPARRVYKNVPHAVQPAQQPKKAR